jgi:uncharacterized protein GlcG (DUF336 family)
LAEKKALTLPVAKQIAAAAASNKFTMVIVIVDDGGNLIDLERMGIVAKAGADAFTKMMGH